MIFSAPDSDFFDLRYLLLLSSLFYTLNSILRILPLWSFDFRLGYVLLSKGYNGPTRLEPLDVA